MSYKPGFICMKVIGIACFLLIFQPSFGQTDFSGIDQLLERNKKALGNNVVAIIYKDGKIAYQKQLGEDFTAKSQVPIGAASEWMTAALVMTFVDQGKLDLDEPIIKYVPLFEKYMKSYVTLRHCLSNTSGIEREQGTGKLMDKTKKANLEEEMPSIAAKEISNNPGKEFFYGNYGMSIAARVCEVVGKKAFERLIQERISRPLKMRFTNFTNDQGYAPNPGAGAKSSALDYINFLAMILNKGKFEDKQVLSEESVAEMQKIQMTDLPIKWTPKSMEGFEYGFGEWILEKDGSGKATAVASTGLFGSFAVVDNCRKYAAVILTGKLLDEQKKEFGLQLKAEIDEIVGSCK